MGTPAERLSASHGSPKARRSRRSQLTAMREEMGLSQESVAGHLGIDASTLSRIERNRIDPRLTTVVKLCEFYDISAMNLREMMMKVDRDADG